MLTELEADHDEPAAKVTLTGALPVYATDVLRDVGLRLASED